MRFLAFLLTFLIGIFLASFVKAEECKEVSYILGQLDAQIKSKDIDAAVAFRLLTGPEDNVVAVVIKKDGAYFTIISEFVAGCLAIKENGSDGVMIPFTPDQLQVLSRGEVIFEAGDIPSFLHFQS